MEQEVKDEIMNILKEEGLELAEDTVVQIVNVAFGIIERVVPKMNVGVGAIIVPIAMLLKPTLLTLVDKIDGKDSPEY